LPLTQGDWKNGMKHGIGVYKSKNGDVYEGEYRLNKRDGYGIKKWASGCSYKGYWTKDLMHGQGLFRWSKGDFYEGSYVDGLREGFGTRMWESGTKYVVRVD